MLSKCSTPELHIQLLEIHFKGPNWLVENDYRYINQRCCITMALKPYSFEFISKTKTNFCLKVGHLNHCHKFRAQIYYGFLPFER
jgi:hypothetical protein